MPYERAIRNQRILLSSTESQEGLAQQLATTSEKISQLEQDREHWKLEAQLVQIKLAKEVQKCVVIEEELRRLHSGGKGVSPVDQGSMVAQAMAKASEVDTLPGHGAGTGKSQQQIDTSMLGQLEGITMDFGESDEKSRENLIKSHYTTRLAQLTAQRQVVDGKVVNFSSECRALQKRLALAEKAKEKHMEELQAAHKNVTQLQVGFSFIRRCW